MSRMVRAGPVRSRRLLGLVLCPVSVVKALHRKKLMWRTPLERHFLSCRVVSWGACTGEPAVAAKAADPELPEPAERTACRLRTHFPFREEGQSMIHHKATCLYCCLSNIASSADVNLKKVSVSGTSANARNVCICLHIICTYFNILHEAAWSCSPMGAKSVTEHMVMSPSLSLANVWLTAPCRQTGRSRLHHLQQPHLPPGTYHQASRYIQDEILPVYL